jgi:hypothetical protein
MCINTKNQPEMVKKKMFTIPINNFLSLQSIIAIVTLITFIWSFQKTFNGKMKAWLELSNKNHLLKFYFIFFKFSFLSFNFFTISCLESNSIDTQIVAMCWKPWTRCNDHIEWDPKKLLRPKKTCAFSKGLEDPWKNLMNVILLLFHVFN